MRKEGRIQIHLKNVGNVWTRRGAGREQGGSVGEEGGVRRGDKQRDNKGAKERNWKWIHICAMDDMTPQRVSIQRRTKGVTRICIRRGLE